MGLIPFLSPISIVQQFEKFETRKLRNGKGQKRQKEFEFDR